MSLTKEEAMKRLKDGNARYIEALENPADVSPAKRADTYQNGQHPYAVVIACADSRVIPEHIFSAGIGELFTIRVAGNVLDNLQLASVEYALCHLKTNLVFVLGHYGCGAVDATLKGDTGTFVPHLAAEIRAGIGEVRNADEACRKNALHCTERLRQTFPSPDIAIAGGMYSLADGKVTFFE